MGCNNSKLTSSGTSSLEKGPKRAPSTTTGTRVLKTVVFFGSARNITPPWGGPTRLGDAILNWTKAELSKRVATLGDDKIKHEVTVFDPLEVFGKGGALASSGAGIQTPHFFFAPGTAPAKMEAMAKKIQDADCYLIVSPEYNHSIPPALSGMMGHFGGSGYKYKPSGIITYSIGPFGGTRAAMALRPFLGELGCSSVSKLACFSQAQNIFNPDGSLKEKDHRQLKQLDALLTEVEWYAVASANQRKASGVP